MKITLAIIAGGQGKRMGGVNKALIQYKGKPFIEHILENTKNLFDERIIISNYADDFKQYNVPVYPDIFNNRASIVGVHAALFHTKTEKTLCIACDMPKFCRSSFKRLIDKGIHEKEVICPIVDNRIQPLCAIYDKRLEKILAQKIKEQNYKLSDIIKKTDYMAIEEHNFNQGDFENANTPAEVKKMEGCIMTVGIITSSDKGYAGEREDKSGAVVREILEKNGFNVIKQTILPDEKQVLAEEMKKMSDNLNLNLVVTTGGTGFSLRDITPEATKMVIERECPGIVEAIRYFSLAITKRAMLSRAVSGIRKNTLIINLPGSPKACEEALGFVMEDIKHGIDILLGSASECARK